MALSAGSRLGPYEILAPLGAGGMGEVYRAHDVTLHRDVAIKVLPPHFTNDAERLLRFEREARVLASLNHPHIGAIYGLEGADGMRALVLELVDGETLADRIARGPIPPADAVTIATQIAHAIEAAHERGVVHRDLKPANIKITPAGIVKVLDFGLAKAVIDDAVAGDLSRTETVIADGTTAGTILGTAAYMSPEQARGQLVDKRTDMWAFGCVLYEMLTGRRAFKGETLSDSIAAILERAPDWSALPAATPPNVRRVLRRCLEKDLKNRWRDIGDVRVELDDREHAPQTAEATGPPPSRLRERALRAALVLVMGATAAFVTRIIYLSKPAELTEIRFEVAFPRGTAANFAQIEISPDGQQLVAAPNFGTDGPLWLRPLGSTSGRFLRGTNGATFPFWSHDGKSIGFFADQKLKRMDLESEAVEIIADAPIARGGAWQADGTILFAPSAVGPLYRVPATGGSPAIATQLEAGQRDHRAPFLLPGGQHFLYYARGTPQARGVYVARLDGSAPKRLLDADAPAVYAASGHLVFARQGVLFAQPFDVQRLALGGAAFQIGGRVSVDPSLSLATLSSSIAGPMAYGTGSIPRTQLVWFDRSGKRLETLGEADKTPLSNPTLSPDGQQIAFSRLEGTTSVIWLTDMRGALTRFTVDQTYEANPVWSFDGRGLLFQSSRGPNGVYARGLAADAREEGLLNSASAELRYPTDASTDGRMIVYNRSTGPPFDIWYAPLVGDRTPRPFVQTMFDERDAQFSPDNKWLAYQSNESGRSEIYLQPFPGPGNRIQVSTGGGQQARWGARGAELFYVAADRQLTSVRIAFAATGGSVVGEPSSLFRTALDPTGQTRQQYMVSADGQRFLMNVPTDAIEPPSITMILNWKPTP